MQYGFFSGLSEGLSSYRRSLRLQPPKENIQHFKSWNSFTFLWLIFDFLDRH
jgi:hypothetical protein